MLTFNERLTRLGFSSYKDYLKSPHWKRVLRILCTSSLYQRCLACDRGKYEIHHISYERLGSERWSDLIPLCRECHQEYHDFIKGNPWIKLDNLKLVLQKLFRFSKKKARDVARKYKSNTKVVDNSLARTNRLAKI